MIRVAIVEDELIAAEHLVKVMEDFTEPVIIDKIVSSVKEAVTYFENSPAVDIIFMDIHLSDGKSFEIFELTTIKAPVVFVTTYEQFTLEAFKHNGIEYILKPYEADAIHQALQKFRQYQSVMTKEMLTALKVLGNEKSKRKILVVKKGTDFRIIQISSIAYFFSSSYVVFAVDQENVKYIVEGVNLTDLMEELDTTVFYRINRNYIVNVHFIQKYKIVERVKLQFELSIPVSEDIIMGQENAKQFRKWIKSL